MAKTGDTFAELSREMGISARKLARYNERGKKTCSQMVTSFI